MLNSMQQSTHQIQEASNCLHNNLLVQTAVLLLLLLLLDVH